MATDYADLLFKHYTGDGVTTDFEYPADYIDNTDIKATVDAVEVPLTVVDATHFRITPAPTTGAAIILFRDSNVTAPKFLFPDRTNIRTKNLDGDFEQSIFLHQETRGIVQDQLDNGGYFLAANIILAPAGNIASVNVQDAIYELDNEKAALNGSTAVAFAVSNLTVAGTVDGRDVSADGLVLDTVVLNNDTAITNPQTTDDINAGYSVRSLWTNTVTESVFVCIDASAGAASWLQLASGTSAGVDSVSGNVPVRIVGTASNPVVEVDNGPGSGFDADTVDGVEASSFLRSDVADTAAGAIDFTGGLLINSTSVTATGLQLNYTDTAVQGVAEAQKALITDSLNDINGINTLGATTANFTTSVATDAHANTTHTNNITTDVVDGSLPISANGNGFVEIDGGGATYIQGVPTYLATPQRIVDASTLQDTWSTITNSHLQNNDAKMAIIKVHLNGIGASTTSVNGGVYIRTTGSGDAADSDTLAVNAVQQLNSSELVVLAPAVNTHVIALDSLHRFDWRHQNNGGGSVFISLIGFIK